MATPKTAKRKRVHSTLRATAKGKAKVEPTAAAAAEEHECTGCCLDCTGGKPAGTMQQCTGEDECTDIETAPYPAVLFRDPGANGGLWYPERLSNLPPPEQSAMFEALVANASPATLQTLVAALVANAAPATLQVLAFSLLPYMTLSVPGPIPFGSAQAAKSKDKFPKRGKKGRG